MRLFTLSFFLITPLFIFAQLEVDFLFEGKPLAGVKDMSRTAYEKKVYDLSVKYAGLEQISPEDAKERFNYTTTYPSVCNYYNPNKNPFEDRVIDETRHFDKALSVYIPRHTWARTMIEYTSGYLGSIEVAVLQDGYVLDKFTHNKTEQIVKIDLNRLYLPKNNLQIQVSELGKVMVVSGRLKKSGNSFGSSPILQADYQEYPPTPSTVPTDLVNALDRYCINVKFTPDYPNFGKDYLYIEKHYPQYAYYIQRRFLQEAEKNNFKLYFETGYPLGVVIKKQVEE